MEFYVKCVIFTILKWNFLNINAVIAVLYIAYDKYVAILLSLMPILKKIKTTYPICIIFPYSLCYK